MNLSRTRTLLFASALLLGIGQAHAQGAPTPYGAPISLEQAKKAMSAAEAEAVKNNWNVVIAVVDSGGHLVLLQRLENTAYGSVEVAQEKARGAIAFRRPTRAFQELIGQGGEHLRLLNLTGDAGVLEGAVPIVAGGKMIGAIGVSGATSKQDAQIAQAGADAVVAAK